MAGSRRPRHEWSGVLLPELLCVVLFHLRCLADRVCFAAICLAWQSTARDLAPPSQLPWLLLPSPDAFSIFSPHSGATRRLYLPEEIRNARFCGSHGACWVTVSGDKRGGIAAVNLLSGARVPLPNSLKLRLGYNTSMYSMLLRNVIFSAAPTSAGCLAATHVSSITNLAFCRLGMDAHWIACRDMLGGLEDIIYFKGAVWQGFHVLISKEDVVVYTPNCDDGPLEMSWDFYHFQKHAGYFRDQFQLISFSVTRYLVESRGKLLMVLRHYDGHPSVVQRTLLFRIFEMKLVIALNGTYKASWVELDELSCRALFLGRGCSRAFEVSQFEGVREGSIYYLDDTTLDISVVLDDWRNFSSADMGMVMYRMPEASRAGDECFPRQFTSESSPSIWYSPLLEIYIF